MSITGFASSPGTAVLPTWWTPPTIQPPIASSSRRRSRSKREGQSGSYATTRIGSSTVTAPSAMLALFDRQRPFHAGLAVAGDRAEEGVFARLEVDARGGGAARDQFGAPDFLAAR